ncbi:MAG: DNA gyrase inhibitor YacG [Methylococcaceae bacterium]|nr:DNA gyrase inhibitor YacG [Methylococcaceae bacterium]MCI0732690.1 DNA gyrase inhibitor YacG [Methylococcaceae bacterium]
MHFLNAGKAGPRVKCPRCGKTVYWDPSFPFRPFCSERCKLIDLGDWANEQHVITGEPLESGSPEDLWSISDSEP